MDFSKLPLDVIALVAKLAATEELIDATSVEGGPLLMEHSGPPPRSVRMLIRIAGVCKTWRSACIHYIPSLWRTVFPGGVKTSKQLNWSLPALQWLSQNQPASVRHLFLHGANATLNIGGPILSADACNASLGQFTGLVTLSIRNVRNLDPSKWLQQLTELRSLDVSNNRLLAAGVRSLATHVTTKVTSLNLQQNYIGPSGADAIVQCLTKLPSLTALSVENNNIRDKGIQTVFKPEVLVFASSLTHLDLSSNNITDVGSYCMATQLQSLAKLQTFHIGNNTIQGHACVELYTAIGRWLRGLTHLSCEKGSVPAFQRLAITLPMLPHMSTLLLERHTFEASWLNPVTGHADVFKVISEMPNLGRLSLRGLALNRPVWLGIMDPAELVATAQSAAVIFKLSNLVDLDLSNTKHAFNVVALLQTFGRTCGPSSPPLRIKKLDLGDNNIGTPHGMQVLCVQALPKMPDLTHLILQGNSIPEVAECQLLAETLSCVPSLRLLNLIDCNIGIDGKKALREAKEAFCNELVILHGA